MDYIEMNYGLYYILNDNIWFHPFWNNVLEPLIIVKPISLNNFDCYEAIRHFVVFLDLSDHNKPRDVF